MDTNVPVELLPATLQPVPPSENLQTAAVKGGAGGPSRVVSSSAGAFAQSFGSSLSPIAEFETLAAQPKGVAGKGVGAVASTRDSGGTISSESSDSSSLGEAGGGASAPAYSAGGSGDARSVRSGAAASAASVFVVPDYIRDFNGGGGGAGRGVSFASLAPQPPTACNRSSGPVAAASVKSGGGARRVLQTIKAHDADDDMEQDADAMHGDTVVLQPAARRGAVGTAAGTASGGAPLFSSSSALGTHERASLPSFGQAPATRAAVPERASLPVLPQRARIANVRSVDGSSFDEEEDAAPPPAARKSPDDLVAAAPPGSGNVFNALLSASEVITVGGRSYLKLECVGRGGSSRVYRVLGDDLGVHALKRVRLSRMEPSAVETYRNEIALLRRLAGSRHIVSLIDADIDYESRCIHMVMELGQMDLAAALALEREGANGARDDNRIRLLWSQMLAAVNTIHCARIVHSDLKPANFVFVGSVLKLIDFGIAKAISADTTNIVRDSQVGTVNYMSPEAISAGGVGLTASRSGSGTIKLGRASDIWSLGCILYQIVYGRTPFAELSLIHKLQAICDPSHKLIFPQLDPPNADLLNVMQACLQRDPLKRPTISGVGGLLEHPFLCPGKADSTPSASVPDAVTLSREALTSLVSTLLSSGADLTHANDAVDIPTKVAGALCAMPHNPSEANISSVVSAALRRTRPAAPAFAAAVAAAAAAVGSAEGVKPEKGPMRAPLRPVNEKMTGPAIQARVQPAPDAENRAPLPVAISAGMLKNQAAALKRPTPVQSAEPAPKETGLVGLLREGLADRFVRLSARLEDTNQLDSMNPDSTFG